AKEEITSKIANRAFNSSETRGIWIPKKRSMEERNIHDADNKPLASINGLSAFYSREIEKKSANRALDSFETRGIWIPKKRSMEERNIHDAENKPLESTNGLSAFYSREIEKKSANRALDSFETRGIWIPKKSSMEERNIHDAENKPLESTNGLSAFYSRETEKKSANRALDSFETRGIWIPKKSSMEERNIHDAENKPLESTNGLSAFYSREIEKKSANRALDSFETRGIWIPKKRSMEERNIHDAENKPLESTNGLSIFYSREIEKKSANRALDSFETRGIWIPKKSSMEERNIDDAENKPLESTNGLSAFYSREIEKKSANRALDSFETRGIWIPKKRSMEERNIHDAENKPLASTNGLSVFYRREIEKKSANRALDSFETRGIWIPKKSSMEERNIHDAENKPLASTNGLSVFYRREIEKKSANRALDSFETRGIWIPKKSSMEERNIHDAENKPLESTNGLSAFYSREIEKKSANRALDSFETRGIWIPKKRSMEERNIHDAENKPLASTNGLSVFYSREIEKKSANRALDSFETRGIWIPKKSSMEERNIHDAENKPLASTNGLSVFYRREIEKKSANRALDSFETRGIWIPKKSSMEERNIHDAENKPLASTNGLSVFYRREIEKKSTNRALDSFETRGIWIPKKSSIKNKEKRSMEDKLFNLADKEKRLSENTV
ncbi:hypothetical protein Bpfe_013695, partial [Biomphalaria pfeifferi]